MTRIRGELVVWMGNSFGTAAEQAVWYAGIIAGHENLQTTLPDPELDDADWMWHDMGFLVHTTRENDAGSGDLLDSVPRYITIDNKAQRRMKSAEDTLLFVLKNDTSSNVSIFTGIAARVLMRMR